MMQRHLDFIQNTPPKTGLGVTGKSISNVHAKGFVQRSEFKIQGLV